MVIAVGQLVGYRADNGEPVQPALVLGSAVDPDTGATSWTCAVFGIDEGAGYAPAPEWSEPAPARAPAPTNGRPRGPGGHFLPPAPPAPPAQAQPDYSRPAEPARAVTMILVDVPADQDGKAAGAHIAPLA